jgi:protein O-mannosyl-transferase
MSKKKVQVKSAAMNTSTGISARQRFWLEALIILILVFITYGNSIQNDYNMDDGYVTSIDDRNTLIKKGIRGIPEILTSNYSDGVGVTYGYRPFGKITMAIEYSIWGNNPHYSHFVNVLLFALNVFLLFLFYKKSAELTGYRNEAVLYGAVILFIVHPIHTEVVCSIKNREEILCYTFVLAALLNLFSFFEHRRWRSILFIAICSALAITSKETGIYLIPLFALIVLFRYVLLNPDFKMSFRLIKTVFTVRNIALFIAIWFGFYLINIFNAVVEPADNPLKFETNPYNFSPASHNIPNGVQTLFFYFKKLLIPFPLLYYYGYNMLPDRDWSHLETYIGIVLFVSVSLYLAYCLIKKKGLFQTFWLFVLGISFLLFSNLRPAPFITGIVAERLVYQASAAYCILFVWLLYELADQVAGKFTAKQKSFTRNVMFASLLLFILPYFILTQIRIKQWKNKTTLYEHDIKYLKNSARANFMLGSHILNKVNDSAVVAPIRKQEALRAQKYFTQALNVYPQTNDALIAMGKLQRFYLNNPDSALYYWKRVDTTALYTYVNAQELIGNIYYFDKLNDSAAVYYYKSAFLRFTDNVVLYRKIIDILLRLQHYQEILPLADIAIQNAWVEGYVNKGDAYLNSKDTVSAVQNYESALSKGFRSDVLINNLDYYYKIHGKKTVSKE